jgi:hypothetical protein
VKADGGKGLWFWALLKKGRIRRLGNLKTPLTIRTLPRRLYLRAKNAGEGVRDTTISPQAPLSQTFERLRRIQS